ncbi:hypothetical protein GCM10020256_62190 [Streptomyces thermocoprophilus]
MPNAVSRSLAAERPFDLDELDPGRHRRELLSAAEEIGARLRAVGKVCRTLTLTVRYADRSATTRTRTLTEPTAHSAALTKAAYGLYDALALQRARVRAVTLLRRGLFLGHSITNSSTLNGEMLIVSGKCGPGQFRPQAVTDLSTWQSRRQKGGKRKLRA